MALNKVDAVGGRLTLNGDYVVHHQDNVEFCLEGDRLRDDMKGKHKGDMFISNMKLIFINGSKSSGGYQSFSMDFQHIRNTEVKQPIFGSNYLKGFIIAEPNGGWEGNANFNIYFPKGGAIEFAELFQRTVKDSLRNRQMGVTPVPPMQPNAYYPAGPQMGYAQQGPQMGYAPQPGFAPPPAGYPGYQPGVAPPAGYYPPPQESLYVYNGNGPPQGTQPNYAPPAGQAPPPYQPGGYPPQNQYQTPVQTSENSKAHEAYMSGNTAFVPSEAPPPYNPTYDPKKRQ